MSEPLTSLKALALDGSPITCTLSPMSVQVIFFALGFLENVTLWKQSFGDVVTDAEWDEIQADLALITTEMLP